MQPSGDVNSPQIAALLATYWAKADPEAAAAAGVACHTIVGHSLDVAACAYCLLDTNASLRRRIALRIGAHESTLAQTVAAIVVLHDVGKLDTRFQLKVPLLAAQLRPRSQGAPHGKYDHGAEGFRQLDSEEPELLHDLLGPHAFPLLRAVCGHHGSLPSNEEPDASRTKLSSQLRREDRRARSAFVRRLVAFFTCLGAELPWTSTVDGAFVQQLAGLCSVADWLGSNVEYFPYSSAPIDEAEYWQAALAQARRACAKTGLIRALTPPARFDTLFPGYTPRDVQLLTEQVSPDEPTLIVVEAAMGKGKTEAALALAARCLANGLGTGVTIGLPTMATSNAMFLRVEQFVRRLYAGDSVQLALAHGRASRQPAFMKLAQHSLRAKDADAPEASVSCARWLINKKRILLAQVGVGTIDQALQAALVVRHQFVRMFGLSQNVVIIDEVHAYDAYMEVLLEHLLRWLGALQVTVVVLSATLPSERRLALVNAWRQAPDSAMLEAPVVACEKPYPLVTVATRDAMRELSASTPDEAARIVRVERQPREGNDLEAIVSRLVDAAASGARVAWVRNTVREAQEAMQALQRIGRPVETMLFHARFRGCDRSAVEQRVLGRFGKGCPPGGRVLIATQVVEQSLDLDFDELHTDLAPIDLLFQRAGRLQRHVRERPSGFDEPRLVVYTPSGSDVASLRFGPSRYVYDVGTLWLANQTLAERANLQIPADIRSLVEQSYHPDVRSARLEQAGEAMREHEQRREHSLEARRTRARQCCIPPTSAEIDGGGALPDDDDTVHAFTRDGQSTTLLPLAWDGATARSLDDHGSGWVLDADHPHAWRVAGELLDQTLSMPARSELTSTVVPGERERWLAWQKRFARFCEDCGLGGRIVPVALKGDDEAKGWLTIHGKTRRVLYSRTLGLLLPSEKDEEEAR